MLATRPDAMAVCAHDVAFRELGEQLCSILQPSAGGAQVEALLARVAVVEVHLMPGETAGTVGAGHVPKLPEELDRRELSSADPLDLAFAIRRVVGDVVVPLVWAPRHASV